MNKEIQVMKMPKRKKAVGFVKSRKSHDKIHKFCHEISHYCLGRGIYIQEFIVDESAGIDVDRECVDQLMHTLEQGDYECVVVTDIFDLTKDVDDLVQLLIHLKDLNCSVYSTSEERYIAPPWEED